MARRRVKGDRAFKNLIKRLEPAVRQEMVVELNLAGRQLLAEMKAKVPVRYGKLKAGLTFKVLPGTLKLKAGILGKPLNKKLFYGNIVEFGRKAQVVTVARAGTRTRVGGALRGYKERALANGVSGAYQLRVKAMPARHFVFTRTRDQINAPFKDLWTKALQRAAAGVGND